MAKRMTDEEIRQFINSKSVTQDNYVAPTVRSNTVSAPAMSVVASQPVQTTVKPTVKQAIKQYGDTIKNSAVKNQGFTLSNAITDLANLYDARRNIATSIPGIGKAYDVGTKTLGNIATNMGIGATKSIEGAADTLSDLYFNPRERAVNYIQDFIAKGKKTADENLKDLKEQQKRDIQKNMTEEFTRGYNEVLPEWEKNSLVRQDNFGGQVAQGVGGMVPSLILGGAYGSNPQLTSLKGLAGREKLMAALGNVRNTYLSQLPSNAMLGASSYGSGLEEALEKGAPMWKSRLSGLSNAAIETGTEMLTGGVPGLEGKGGLDQFFDPLLSKVGGYGGDLLRGAYRAGGEGLEELVGTYLDALAKKGILGEDINWKDVNREALQSGLVGAATGALLDAPQLVNEIQSTRQERANRPKTQTQLNTTSKPTQTNVQETVSEPTQMAQEAQNIEEKPINQEEKKMPEKEVLEPITQEAKEKQKPRNTGLHYGDGGKGKDTNFFSMTSSRRSTGHMGTGTYFVKDANSNVGSKSDRSSTLEINLDDYDNIYTPKTEKQMDKVYDVLKGIDNQDVDAFELLEIGKTLGKTDEQIMNAKKAVDEYIKEMSSKDYTEQLESDSPATIFMKDLGFNGIDVRHLDKYDNGEYGSVIYDLKNKKVDSKSAEKIFKNIKTKEDMDSLISNLENKVDNIKTGDDLKNTFKEIYNIYKVYNKSNDVYEIVEKDGQYGTKFESEFYNPEIKYKPLNEEIKIQKENLRNWLSYMQKDTDKIIYDNQDKVTPTIGKNIKSLNEATPITTDDFKNKLHDYIDKETEEIKGKFESKDGRLYRGGNEIKYLYRAIDQAEMDSIKSNGYIKSNQSKNIGYEIEQGLTDFKDNYPGFYLPRNADGYIIKIKIKPENGFFYDTDEYAKTPNKIPSNQIVEINGETIGNSQQEYNEDLKTPTYKEVKDNTAKVEEGTSDSSFSNAKEENQGKAEKVVDNKITAETLKKMSKDLTKELNESFKLKKNEAYSRTPQTAVKSMSVYENAPAITDFDRNTVVHTIMSDEAAKIDAKARYEKNGSLEENAAYIRGLLQSDKRLTKNDKALAIYTMNEAYKQGNKAIGDGIVSDLTVLDVEAGQWAQASKLMKQMSPFGQLQTFVKMINNSVEKGNPRFKNVKITEEQINKVLDCYDKDGNWDADKFAKNMEEFKFDIQQQMTPTLMDKFNSVRMLGMLGAPRTHIRNMLGNVGNMGLRTVKNFNDRVLESVLIGNNTEQRTRTFKPATKEIKDYVSNLTKEELFGGNKYSDTKTELERNMKVFNEHHKGMARIVNPISKAMNMLSDGNSWALDYEDKLFSSVAYKRSLQEYLTAKGMETTEDIDANPQVLADGKEFAMQQALEATYRQDSELAAAISNYVKKAEKPNAKKTDKFLGLIVESNIPFKKTPINIAKTGIEFSPIGLTTGIYDTLVNVKNGKMEMSQAIDEISKGITGLGLLGIGALLAHNGFELHAADDDKEKKAKYDKSLGEMEYSIKIGNRYYDLSWMAPAAMPLYTGIELYQTLVNEKEFNGNAVINTLAKTIDPLSSMSLLEGLSKSVQSYSKTPGEFISKFTLSSLENYITQYIPTLLSQIANLTDDKKRYTGASGDSDFTEFEKTWNSIKFKVPGLRQTLPEQTDAWGRTQMNDPVGFRIFNSFFNPANNSLDKKDDTDRELERLYNDLGEDNYYATRSLPKMSFDKYLTIDKQRVNLSNDELVKYKKTYGKTAKEGADKLIKTSEYKNATDEEKGQMLAALYDYANQKAKEEYGKEHNLDYDDYKLDQLYSLVDAYNIPIEKAVSNKSIQQLKADGNMTAKQKKISAVDDIDGLTKTQKDVLKRKFTMFMGNPGYKEGEYALVAVLNDSNVSEETKEDIRRFLSLE